MTLFAWAEFTVGLVLGLTVGAVGVIIALVLSPWQEDW